MNPTTITLHQCSSCGELFEEDWQAADACCDPEAARRLINILREPPRLVRAEDPGPPTLTLLPGGAG